MIIRYESTAALRADYIARGCEQHNIGGNSWYGGETTADSLRKLNTATRPLCLRRKPC